MDRSSLGQLLLVGVPGLELDSETAHLFKRVQPGGYILFGRNIQSPFQLRKLIDDLRDLSRVEPIITIDQEGGRVSRLRLIGNEPPNAQQLRTKGDRALIAEHGRLTGQLLRLFGFNLDLCPVLDVSFDDDADNSLRGRCYGTSVRQVIDFAGAFNDALLETGVLSCGKHFPGYAAAALDPHHELPQIDRSREELDRTEIAIFREFAHRVSSMMVCHAWYPAFDPVKTPGSLSKAIVTGLLVTELGFDGLIMTDDLDMGAIINETGFAEMMDRAMRAGNHLAMICHRVHLVEDALTALLTVDSTALDCALAGVDRFKRKMALPYPFSEERFRALDQKVWELRVATLGPEGAGVRSPEDGKRSPVETY
ncbi:MAG TPA: glycoside hydrolase family 3 N-terminal domain-containing protein [Chthoniobacterales bacterium]|jgi:beta-N-acetylhexosaminidase|nr:glycoside hydrolase family 3 N-terminal domain-containing protein [Chthoniobacterales bacterium]